MAEATFKSIKTEFVKGEKFMATGLLQQAFAAYAYWSNHKRLHASLGYLPPAELNKRPLLNFVV
ncbi:IS3 family transposase [Snodgrassella alvi]|uniref:IS3 family transposase n=1 Tax=Snodgrassella alvi TaxID=1196083 RepID=UPI000C1F6E07|nr:IS3 family transposase [Snodgrassella alvi]